MHKYGGIYYGIEAHIRPQPYGSPFEGLGHTVATAIQSVIK